MANGLGAGPSAIVTPDVNQLIGRPDIVVEPRSTAMLTDAFRQGFITADDIMERVGERSRLKKKVDIEQSKQTLAELQDPALIQARRNQQLAAGAQAEGALANAPLAQKAKEAELKAAIFDAQAKPGGFDAMQDALTKAGFPVPVDVNTGLTDANKSEIQKRFSSLTQYTIRKSDAESRVKGIETKFFPTEQSTPEGGKVKGQLEKLYHNGQEISSDQLKTWVHEAETFRKLPFSSYYSLQPGQVAAAPAAVPAAAPVVAPTPALSPVTMGVDQLKAKRAQVASATNPVQVSQMSDAEIQAWQPPAPVAAPTPAPAPAPTPAQPAVPTGMSFVTGTEAPPNVRPLQENTMSGQLSDRPEIKNAAAARSAYAPVSPILDSINPDGTYKPNIEDKRLNDFALIVSYAKIIDPNSVVREGEVDRLRDAQDFVAKYFHSFPEAANVLFKRQFFSPTGRRTIQGLLEVSRQGHQESQRKIVTDFANQAQQNNLNVPLAVGPDRYADLVGAGWQQGQPYVPKVATVGSQSGAPASGEVFTAPNSTKKACKSWSWTVSCTMTKICSECFCEKANTAFPRQASKKDGLKAACRSCGAARTSRWREHNIERAREATRHWRTANPEKRRAYRKLHAVERRDEKRQWAASNRDKVNQYGNQYYHNAQKKDPAFVTTKRLRGRITMALKRGGVKSAPTLCLIGCDIDTLRNRIAAKFQPGMSWENWGNGPGKWNLDHIKPCAAHDLTDPEQQRRCFHYTNLQPLWFEDNMKKGAKF